MFKGVYKVIQAAIILPVLLCAYNNCFAQIKFKNPSFEGTPPLPIYNTPLGWLNFNGPPAILPDSIYYGDRAYKKAYNGLYYLAFDGSNINQLGDTVGDGVYQTLPCYLKKDVKYSFSLYAIGIIEFYAPHKYRNGGGLRIWLADDSVKKSHLIYKIFPLDTNYWQRIDVNFIPIANLRNIIFEGYQPPNECIFKNESGIDYLSPITFNHKDYIKANASDTLVTELKKVQLSLKHIQDTGISYSWCSIPAGFISNDTNPVVMPTQTTQYIAIAHCTCGMDITDTVTVNVKLNQGGGNPKDYIQTYLIKNKNWIIQSANTPIQVKIFNALGQLLYIDNNYQNNLNPSLLNWTSGMYFYNITYGSGAEERGKIIFINN